MQDLLVQLKAVLKKLGKTVFLGELSALRNIREMAVKAPPELSSYLFDLFDAAKAASVE